MAPAASQSYRRTAGDNRSYWGRRQINKKTDREEARGGERDAHAGKLFGDMELRRVNLGGAGVGGSYPSVERST